MVRKEGVHGCLFSSQDPQAQAAYLAIPTLLKARTSRRCGETSAVLKDRKRGTENSTGKGWAMGFVRLIEDGGLAAMVMGREEVGRAILHRGPHYPFLPKTVGNQTRRFSHMLATASAKAGLASTPGQGPGLGQEPHRMGTPPPKSPAEPASLHLLQHTRSARRNYRIAGARLVRCNYPPPLSCAALGSTGTTRRN
ncbi:hypothetical protein E2I00_004529 [Balaenoptera physalus]|uniref:Uncharacterized protein n=1 Tax=Balaenoptera physalus TaxID=9770 RepID=A0A643CCL2_BALPH|nr:hypothetical protein E2I00_004529 [Balaenoptera physalus]